MKAWHKNGITSVITRVIIRNATTGARITGLTSASSGLIISTIADNEAAPTTYTVAGSTIETITTLGTFATPTTNKCRFKEVDATNHPGLYEIQIANGRFAVSSARSVIVTVSGYSGMDPVDSEIQLVSVDPYDTARFGLTSLPNAIPGATGGLFIAGTNAATVVTTSFTTTFTGSLTGSVASVSGAVGSVTGNVGGNVVGSVGSVSGAVGSVTGAVGSVTGNVGGNVVGSVASVSGAVGSVTGNVGGNVTGSVGSVASGGISASSLAADAITAAKVASDVGTEIGTAVWASATRTLTALGSGVIVAATFGTDAIDSNAVKANALDKITMTDPAGTVDTWPKQLTWLFRRWGKKHKMVVGTLTMFADDGTTPSSTQTTSDSGTESIVGPTTP